MAPRPDSFATPRGKLPPRVYWTRRALVIGLPLLLVVVLVSVFSGGGGDGTPARATLAASGSRTSGAGRTAHARALGPVAVDTEGVAPRARGSKPTKQSDVAVPLAAPDGPCVADEITVTPSVRDGHAGGPVTVSVQLRTARPACTFAVSRSSLAVKITSGSDFIWSTQRCRGSVPKETVVVRSAQPAVVPVTWNGRRITDGTCGDTNGWARPGYYHALAAVIGSAPSDTQFALSLPPRPVVTKTAHPKPKATRASHAARSQSTKTRSGKRAAGRGPTGTGSACGGDNSATSC